MDNTKTIEKIIEAENTAKAYIKELDEKKKAFALETQSIIEQMRKDAYDKTNAEIESEKKAFLALQSERVEKEKKKNLDIRADIQQKKQTSLEKIAEQCFCEIIEG